MLGLGVAEAEEVAPNGFVLMGLAPELIQAVVDLGYTQPTAVQEQTIPLAMAGDAQDGQAARFLDLMVSSQTGSGKTAAFLLPVLHTLLKQQEAAANRLRAAIARFEAHTGPLQPHFAYGELNHAEYALAHVMHLYNHLGLIRPV